MKIRKQRIWLLVLSIVVAIAGIGALGATVWYKQMLSPVDVNSQQTFRINIKEGMGSSDIAKTLEDNKIIKNSLAFSIYTRLHNSASKFKAGVYSVKASQSVDEIINHLTSGKTDEIAITFYPGSTLNKKMKNSDGREVESVLLKAGFSDDQIKKAFAAKYDSLVFAGRPENAGLEGYIYGETFYISPDETAEQVLQRSIDHLEKIVKKYNLEEKFKARGLTLYQGITLASIIQRESIGCGSGVETCEDQRKIASVFYNRLKANMPLGSDVTYQYIADKTGLERSPNLKSPYNTRIQKGLTPGPIASPSLSALNAAADPIHSDFLYFLGSEYRWRLDAVGRSSAVFGFPERRRFHVDRQTHADACIDQFRGFADCFLHHRQPTLQP